MNEFPTSSTNENPNNPPDDFPDSSGAFFDGKLNKTPIAGEKFVVFYLHEKPFGVAAKRVAEVSRPLAVAAVPHAPEWLSGIANLRGEIVSVIDLPKTLGKELLTVSAKTKFIILQSDGANTAVAFHADRLGEIVFIGTDEIEPTVETNPYICGQTLYNFDVLQLIDTEKLLVSLTVN